MAAKIVDGFFIGDALSSMDLTFLVANKIDRIVNCAGLELENYWEEIGMKYMTFEWQKIDTDLSKCGREEMSLLPNKNKCPLPWLEALIQFVDNGLYHGHGILIHSLDGRNRACSCVLAYLMYAYGWHLDKAISFVQSKRPDLLPSQELYEQLKPLNVWLEAWYCTKLREAARPEQSFSKDLLSTKLKSWEVPKEKLYEISLRAQDEILLQNTYVNSRAMKTSSNNYHFTSSKVVQERAMTCNPNQNNEINFAAVQKRRNVSFPTVSWIDIDLYGHPNGKPVLLSPFTKRRLPERPPGPSYKALHVTGFWIDLEHDENERERISFMESSRDEINEEKDQSTNEKSDTGRESPQKLFDFKGRHQNKNFNKQVETSSNGLFQNHSLDLRSVRERLVQNGIAIPFGGRHALQTLRFNPQRVNSTQAKKKSTDTLNKATNPRKRNTKKRINRKTALHRNRLIENDMQTTASR